MLYIAKYSQFFVRHDADGLEDIMKNNKNAAYAAIVKVKENLSRLENEMDSFNEGAITPLMACTGYVRWLKDYMGNHVVDKIAALTVFALCTFNVSDAKIESIGLPATRDCMAEFQNIKRLYNRKGAIYGNCRDVFDDESHWERIW